MAKFEVVKAKQDNGKDWGRIELDNFNSLDLEDDENVMDMADWPWMVINTHEIEDNNILAWCCTQEDADMIAAALNKHHAS
jgi:hypothetical protein